MGNSNSARYMSRSTNKPKPRRRRGGCLFLLVGLCLLGFSVWQGWKQGLPNPDYANTKLHVKQAITWNGEASGYGAKGSGEELLIPLKAVQERIMPAAIYEKTSKLVILTNESHVAAVSTEGDTGWLDGNVKNWGIGAQLAGDQVYVPAKVLEELEVATVKEFADTGNIRITFPGDTIQTGKIKQQDKVGTVAMRYHPEKKAPIVRDLPAGTAITMWSLQEDWILIQDDGGRLGYVREEEVELLEKESVPKVKPLSPPQFVEEEIPVSLAWEAVYSRNPNPDSLPNMPGINVISPTWFSLKDNEGNVASKADKRLMDWAKAEGKYVWALFSNSFDPERTTAALASFERRERSIRQLLAYAEQYKLDGINIDYENVNVEDRDNLTQFVRELTPLFRMKGLVVSIDVTAKSSSGRWSQFLDREALGAAVDYMMVMAYDEHWAASPKSGSVSSLPWAKSVVARIIEEDNVPAHKMVLGMPLYTRIWSETSEAGETKVKSQSVGMRSIKEWLEKYKLTPTFSEQEGQYYAEATDKGVRQRVWIEDETSINARIKMAKELKLGGVAVWARALGDDDIWKIVHY
ncbi:glycosyl hydrolase family 18 protein [Paenibacillus taiwanensis]|uniref:glycosyl hydrolase family 18 protein n=1 Tax=Paenibacillus taiwanensis TaxID=401638 RepID=UPI001FDF3E8A|nr:glycosyl hydrolase family 18 protein [Paenibacillus taiwanensis]